MTPWPITRDGIPKTLICKPLKAKKAFVTTPLYPLELGEIRLYGASLRSGSGPKKAMDDKACRLEILRKLKDFYGQDPHALVQKETLLGDWKIEDKALERNTKYLVGKGLAWAQWFYGGFIARITSEGIDFLETGEPSGLAILSPVTIQQEFHGPVGAVAGRDVNVQITFAEVLNKLADAVQADQKIPPEEKRSLIDRLKSLANNEWIRSIGTSVLADVTKK